MKVLLMDWKKHFWFHLEEGLMSRTKNIVWSQRNKNIQKHVCDCLYAVWSVHFWITAEGKTKCIHLECTHITVEDVPQRDTFSVWYPDIPLARVYYSWTWRKWVRTIQSYVIWSNPEPVKNNNALRGQLIL